MPTLHNTYNFAYSVGRAYCRKQPCFVVRKDEPNIAKYADLATAHAAKHGSCFLGTVIIPSAGPIPKHSFLVLKEVGFSDQKATKALREMDIARTRAFPKFTRAPTAPTPPA